MAPRTEQLASGIGDWPCNGRRPVDLGIRDVFAAFAAVTLVGGLVTLLFAIETAKRNLGGYH